MTKPIIVSVVVRMDPDDPEELSGIEALFYQREDAKLWSSLQTQPDDLRIWDMAIDDPDHMSALHNAERYWHFTATMYPNGQTPKEIRFDKVDQRFEHIHYLPANVWELSDIGGYWIGSVKARDEADARYKAAQKIIELTAIARKVYGS